MNNQQTLGAIFLLTLFVLLFNLDNSSGVYGIKYGPSLTSLPSPVLKLEDYPNYSVLVPLTRHKISAYPYELAQEDSRWRDIKAIIKAPEGFRVMMVIQMLYLGLGYEEKLEQDLKAMGLLKSCVDSIQIFEHGELIHDICGSVNYTDKSAHPHGLSGPRTFLSKGTSLIVGLQFGKKLRQSTESSWLHLDYRHKLDIWSRKFSLAISFTAFKECEQMSKSSIQDDLHPCSPLDENNLAESSSGSTVKYCIHSHLFCDGIMNCVNDDSNMTIIGADEDEKQCPSSSSSLQNSDKHFQLSASPMVNFRPEDKYYAYNHLSTASPSSDNNNFQNYNHTQLSLGPSSTVLLIVLTILSVMILGIIIRLCCTKCAGTPPPHRPRLSSARGPETVSNQSSVWTVSLNGDSFVPSFIVHSQCSRFDTLKDLPPSYEDLFPVEIPKTSEIELQMTSSPNSTEDIPTNLNSRDILMNQETPLNSNNSIEPKNGVDHENIENT